MSLFRNRFAAGIIKLANTLARRHSKDPVEPILTETVKERPSIQALMTQFDAVHAEVMAALSHAKPIEGDLFFTNRITSDGKWDRIYIKWYAPPSKMARDLFPTLTRILDEHKDIQLAMVSILKAGGMIKPHYGSWCGCIRVHIGIETPNDPECSLTNGGHEFFWADREIYAFDDTYLHSAKNDTDRDRIVLFLDVERTMKGRLSQAVLRWINVSVGRLTTRE